MEDLQGGTLALEHRYDLERRSGEFGLFEVYRGVQHPFERPVWIKVCGAPAEFGAPAMYDRLKMSVLDAAAVGHDRASTVVDFGDFEKHVPFVVSERANGVTLQDYVEKHGTLPPEEALEILRRVAEIVDDVHRGGSVHGGIAPWWVTIADEGVFLDHFALQPTMDEIRGLDGVIMSSDLLWSLPPEQFGDAPVEHSTRADVWALGALLYWMLAGVHPYFDDPTDTADAILRLRNASRPRPLDELGVQETVSDFVARALEPKPADRFASVEELLEAHPLAEEKIPNTPARRQPAAPQPVVEPPAGGSNLGTALAGVIMLLLLTNLGWFFYKTSTEPSAAPTVQSLPAEPASILPEGMQVITEPAGGKVFRVSSEGGEEEFGDTPMVLDPKAGEGKELPVILRKEGRVDVRLDVVERNGTHELIVHLPPAAGAKDEGK